MLPSATLLVEAQVEVLVEVPVEVLVESQVELPQPPRLQPQALLAPTLLYWTPAVENTRIGSNLPRTKAKGPAAGT